MKDDHQNDLKIKFTMNITIQEINLIFTILKYN